MLSDFAEKKETFFDLKKQNFQTPKNRTFSKGKSILLAKNAIFLNLDLTKERQEIILSDFAEKKETVFDLKKHNFSKPKKA